MSALGVRNLAGYNRKVKDAEEAKKPILDPIMREGERATTTDDLASWS